VWLQKLHKMKHFVVAELMPFPNSQARLKRLWWLCESNVFYL